MISQDLIDIFRGVQDHDIAQFGNLLASKVHRLIFVPDITTLEAIAKDRLQRLFVLPVTFKLLISKLFVTDAYKGKGA